MDYPKYFVTQLLSAEQIVGAMRALPPILAKLFPADTLFAAQYGWRCELHPDLCYRDMRVGIGWMGKFCEDSLKSIVVPGDSDFTISAPENAFVVHFCHEGDIHTGGTNTDLQKSLWNEPSFRDFPLSWREGVYLAEK